ncbi:3-hydroxyacyl-CoA dehydrogenase [Marinigracilibium pacificum]|uniref:3-hydroxyacyl-CoA dehydrogenase n=1 Tax=Marinigracilibium pacificum TaxID=2729599 RepID=A0A848IZH2_9BACT|nr:3-hydroxyacyl-CoA dehydrogenase [Marinigracilibium pacificum]NMM48548.1 3-hydroxyacyl-CoA dehydrogenase [Marinigracilibium pacificum]
MSITNVTIAGGGTLGSQISWQTAFSGFNVTVYDAFESGIEQCKDLHQRYAKIYFKDMNATEQQIKETHERLSYTTNLANAVKDADLVNESIPEDPDIKTGFYKELGIVAPEKTIFTTNSSTTIPSMYARVSGRPDMFLALHFANQIWKANIGEVMRHEGTDPKVFETVIQFAKDIGMVPIVINKEQPGYVINSLLVPFLIAAIDLMANEIATPQDIDKTWMIGMGGKVGPAAIMDMIGMKTVYDVCKLIDKKENTEISAKRVEFIYKNFIETNKMGLIIGEGIYKYPNPEFMNEGFLK